MATTKTHIGRLLAKLDARDRAQLVIAAYQSGLAWGQLMHLAEEAGCPGSQAHRGGEEI